MIYRTTRSKGEYRKQTKLYCAWCAESFLSERSDSKYCCDSHKTLACNDRKWRAREREQRHEERQPRLRLQLKPQMVAKSIIPAKPIQTAEPQLSQDAWKELEKNMNEMLAQSVSEQKLSEEKQRIARLSSLFSEINDRVIKCADAGVIRNPDISAIQNRINSMQTEPGLHSTIEFQPHVEFLDQRLVPLIKGASRELWRSGSRRVEFQLPEDVLTEMERLFSTAKSLAA